MPPYDDFSRWLETICTHKRTGHLAAGQTKLPSIAQIGRAGWGPTASIGPTDPFVEIESWHDGTQFGEILTRGARRKISGKHLKAVYARFSQLVLKGFYKGQPIATINCAYNAGLPHPYCWEPGKLPGDGILVPVKCPHSTICPFLAPIVFRFGGGTTHNAAARAFAIAHSLTDYIPPV